MLQFLNWTQKYNRNKHFQELSSGTRKNRNVAVITWNRRTFRFCAVHFTFSNRFYFSLKQHYVFEIWFCLDARNNQVRNEKASDYVIRFIPPTDTSSVKGQFWSISLQSCCEMVPVLKRLPLWWLDFTMRVKSQLVTSVFHVLLQLCGWSLEQHPPAVTQHARQLMVDRAVKGGAASQQEAETEASPVLSVSSSSSLSAAINNILPFIPESLELPVTPDP